MINVLSKILGRKKSGNSNETANSCPKVKESQTIWQKATSLRQSLRHSSRAKVGQKPPSSSSEFSQLTALFGDDRKAATLCVPSSTKSWGSQRNLARERRSLAAAPGAKSSSTTANDANKRSLHARSLCMSGDWDVDLAAADGDEREPLVANRHQGRSPRKLTKDSGYETSAQGDPDYANSISDWLSEEKALDQMGRKEGWGTVRDEGPRQALPPAGDKRSEWSARHRPLSFSHQEVNRAKQHRQLRHSYSQREVSAPRQSHFQSRQTSAESLANCVPLSDLKQGVAQEGPAGGPSGAKSAPHLPPRLQQQSGGPRLSTSSAGSLLSELDDNSPGNNMVTRRFKKGSVYDALASTSGLDFSPVVQLKTYNSRKEEASPKTQGPKHASKSWESPAKIQSPASLKKEPDVSSFKENAANECLGTETYLNSAMSNQTQGSHELKRLLPQVPKVEDVPITSHEKYPSWPVSVSSSPSTGSYRSHSWTGHTDYPKEKIVYTRPKKAHQFKISTNNLQPVLERTPDHGLPKKPPEPVIANSPNRNGTSESYRRCASECSDKQFDFEAFHTPCIPQCFGEKDYMIHSPPERDSSSAAATSPSSRAPSEVATNDSNGFLSRYEEVLRHQAQYSVPLSSSSGWSKQRGSEGKGSPASPDTPFLDRLRLENAWQSPPPPAPVLPPASPQQHQQQANDYELASENGTWMGSMESSSHGRGLPKWQGSYSDLSTLSTQLSNRSSLFDSGHSTMPESGRLSPQSSCESTAPSLLIEGPTRAQVVARHGCHREIVAHSARVQQPERHGSESVLYYASGSMASNRSVDGEAKPSKAFDASSGAHQDASFSSHASLTLTHSPSASNVSDAADFKSKPNKFPTRQDSRKSSNSCSSEDSNPRRRSRGGGEDTSGSSSDVSNITCISNYRGSKSQSLDEPSGGHRSLELDPSILSKYKSFEASKSRSMDETTRKFLFADAVADNGSHSKRHQRISDPELKAIQKQAVMSFYQRMSLAESIKSDHKSGDQEPPPPYEASSPTRLKIAVPKLSLLPNKFNKQWEGCMPRTTNTGLSIAPPAKPPAENSQNNSLQNHHSKSVPNLFTLKSPSLDLPPSHPLFKQNFAPQWNGSNGCGNQVKRGSPLAKEEIISWDQLPSVLEKKREALERVAPIGEHKDPPDDNGNCSNATHYFKSHKSPRKVQLKEVHHSNETASVRVMTPDGVTLVQTAEHHHPAASPCPASSHNKAPAPQQQPLHKRRPAPPPPPKQPPKRPPPPPPPATPPPSAAVVVDSETVEVNCELRTGPDLSPRACSPDLPLPPPPPQTQGEAVVPSDEPLPPPPDHVHVDAHARMIDSSSLVYPKNSYMSYRSERKIGRQGFDGKYRRSFHASVSSVDLTTLGSSFHDEKDEHLSPSSWEQMHNIRQHGTTVIFHSDCLQPVQSNNRLQRSSSQDCMLVEEPVQNTNNISNGNLQKAEHNQSSSSISTQCSENNVQSSESALFPASHERRIKPELLNSFSSHSHLNGISSKSKCPQDVIINCELVSEDVLSIDNGILTDDSSFVDSMESDTSSLTSVDHNQNSVFRNLLDDADSKKNSNDYINRTNSSTQTTDTPKLRRKSCKTKEELECEKLSMDFIHHYGDLSFKNLLVPAPSHKTMSDYMDGLLNLELETGGHPVRRNHSTENSHKLENGKRNEKWSSNDRCNSLFESKMQQLNHCVECMEINDNKNVDGEADLKKRKEELIISIGKKVEILRGEQATVREEMLQNQMLGQEISNRLQKVAKPNEIEKFCLHVEEMEKIVNLLLSLSGRLARAENFLSTMPKESNSEERRILEAKRDKLCEQHEDACRLKESIDRRSNQVSTFLHRYFTDNEYADYDHFIKMKTKLIVDVREMDERINLGEEQLAALRNSVVVQLWKSANS